MFMVEYLSDYNGTFLFIIREDVGGIRGYVIVKSFIVKSVAAGFRLADAYIAGMM